MQKIFGGTAALLGLVIVSLSVYEVFMRTVSLWTASGFAFSGAGMILIGIVLIGGQAKNIKEELADLFMSLPW